MADSMHSDWVFRLFNFLQRTRSRWLRAGFVAVVVTSLLLCQLVSRRSAEFEAEACPFIHPVPGLVPSQLTVAFYAPILVAAFLLPMPFAFLVICLVLVGMGFQGIYLADPAWLFRGCYGGGGENEDVTGVAILSLLLVGLSFLCCVSLAVYTAASLWLFGRWVTSRVRNG